MLWLGYLTLRFGTSAVFAGNVAPRFTIVLLVPTAIVAYGAYILFASADVAAFFAAAASWDRAPSSASRH